ELIRLTRARRDMVANFSHDMRTPISSIRLLVEMLRQNLGKNPQGDQTKLAKIASATDSLQHMMQELLDLSTIESGRAIMRMVETTFGDILSRSLEMMEAQFEEKGLTVINEAAMDVRVLADPDQVRRVINNIFHNAVKFTPKKGEIVISTAQTTSHLAVCIKDSGPGIPPFERTRVFERFYQVDGTRSGAADSRGRGTGLGLAIGKHIIEAHGGRIWVEGGIPSGACLLFTLPLA
ncbi:MAG TPA: HAMP domain-containing sensor histidine kinase, partial [Aggregatilineales bacterium]|nr:HAMP domain-containing sensor histidine kinase [Aggregatilineales bacterium]